ncbi:hypothetical protein L596_025409 [Steinernema carpocapsae]|uniref:Uncharacterized protein n=1 Tax=Steinernema carpocapsae TaxID=34508 RepID=A0A4U5M7P2_STECR|nr:hypothetical protein L596_025409 [Steinernema carpocapsae]
MSRWVFKGEEVPSHLGSDLLVVIGDCFEEILDEALTAASESHRCSWFRSKPLDQEPDKWKMKNRLHPEWLRRIRFCSASSWNGDLQKWIQELTKTSLMPHTVIAEIECFHDQSVAGQLAILADLARHVVDSREREELGTPTFPVIAYVPKPTRGVEMLATLFTSCVVKVDAEGRVQNIASDAGESEEEGVEDCDISGDEDDDEV